MDTDNSMVVTRGKRGGVGEEGMEGIRYTVMDGERLCAEHTIS